MKRLIIAASNKRKSLDAFVNKLNSLGYTRYKAQPNYSRNIVEILDDAGNIVTEIELATVTKSVTRRKFRKATPKEIELGKNLYVPETYETTTEEQINEPKVVTDVVDKYYN